MGSESEEERDGPFERLRSLHHDLGSVLAVSAKYEHEIARIARAVGYDPDGEVDLPTVIERLAEATKKPCATCRGTGEVRRTGEPPRTCSACKGAKTVDLFKLLMEAESLIATLRQANGRATDRITEIEQAHHVDLQRIRFSAGCNADATVDLIIIRLEELNRVEDEAVKYGGARGR